MSIILKYYIALFNLAEINKLCLFINVTYLLLSLLPLIVSRERGTLLQRALVSLLVYHLGGSKWVGGWLTTLTYCKTPHFLSV